MRVRNLPGKIELLICGCMVNGSVAQFGKNVFGLSGVILPHKFTPSHVKSSGQR
jgi:hypothetical protein